MTIEMLHDSLTESQLYLVIVRKAFSFYSALEGGTAIIEPQTRKLRDASWPSIKD
jgi:hypothetical protein